jgi:predicted nuclease of predicted toxin-antitoxin system
MIKLVIDMNLSPEWVPVFKETGWQAIHWSEIGAASAPDAQIMAWAASHDHVVFTHDLDFGALLAASGAHGPSVIQIRHEDTRPGTIGLMVIAAIQATLADLRNGALVTVHPKRMRIRILPLRPRSI